MQSWAFRRKCSWDMLQVLGKFVSRFWLALLISWALLFIGLWWAAPAWPNVAQDIQFSLLPADAPSRKADTLYKEAFPLHHVGSNVVIVLEREVSRNDAPEREKRFIEKVLEPGLRKIAREEGGIGSEATPQEDVDPFAPTKPAALDKAAIVQRIRTPNAPGTGALQISSDRRALLVILDLTTEYSASRNWPLLSKIEGLLADAAQNPMLPSGDKLFLTGSAILGRDHTQAELDAARAIGILTIVLALSLLILIYRAPLVALIPLLTVYVAVQISLKVLALLAQAGYVSVFQGLEIYIAIICYGAGIDYYLLLAARYKEELDLGNRMPSAAAKTIEKTGIALTASAGTVMVGIAMMAFAQFGRFREAGITIPLSLLFTLCATFTFSVPLLRLANRWIFWPQSKRSNYQKRVANLQGRFSLKELFVPGELGRIWARIGSFLNHRPGQAWLASVAVLAPFAFAGGMLGEYLNFNPIGDLPVTTISVQGTRALERHFPGGILGPLTVVLIDRKIDFSTPHGHSLMHEFTVNLQKRKDELGLVDVRSVSAPLGITEVAQHAFEGSDLPKAAIDEALRQEGSEHYLTDLGGRTKVGTRLELVSKRNPFSSASIADLLATEKLIEESLPSELRQDSQIAFDGTTVSLEDLKTIELSDRKRIQLLVLATVFLILLMLFRRLALSLYLIMSVLFSFYATLGVTFALFWLLNPSEFAGLDWKVAIFLFTILIAVGEDYNIFLMTRIHEEQDRVGTVPGILQALVRTGAVISGAGIIMAGTFASLLIGSLSEMKQLGFALAFGVLLDTFLVRPVLVPSFLIWIDRHRAHLPGRTSSVKGVAELRS
jgi:RND superfamily putative drug exporter